MLEAIALGIPIVTQLWLENCAEAGCLVDEKSYILKDSRKEKEIGFSLSSSLTKASRYPLLKVISHLNLYSYLIIEYHRQQVQ